MADNSNLDKVTNTVEQKSKEVVAKISESAVGQKGKVLAGKAQAWTGKKLAEEQASFEASKQKDEIIKKNYEGVLWTKFIGDGLTVKTRADFLLRWAVLPLTVLLALSISHDITSNTVGVQEKLNRPSTVSFFDTFWTSPINTLKATFKGNTIVQINDGAIAVVNQKSQEVEHTEAFMGGLTQSNDYKAFVADVLKDPIKMLGGGTGAYTCKATDRLDIPWVNTNKLADVPLCHISSDKETVYLMSYVNFEDRVLPTFGIFHKDESAWKYFNVEDIQSWRIEGYETIRLKNIAKQIKKDFPMYAIERELVDIQGEKQAMDDAESSFKMLQNIYNKVAH